MAPQFRQKQDEAIRAKPMQHFLVGFTLSALVLCPIIVTAFMLGVYGKTDIINVTQGQLVLIGVGIGLGIALLGGLILMSKAAKSGSVNAGQ